MQHNREKLEAPDISEKGGLKGGVPQRSDERLFMQLLVFGGCARTSDVVEQVASAGVDAVVYEDLNDPQGVALLTASKDPNTFVDRVRPLIKEGPMAALTLRSNLTMFGRTYSLGYEPDLQNVLFDRPLKTVLNEAWPWAIWYPLRRKGGFERLDPREKGGIMREHGMIGRSYAGADLAHDVRLACHGLDQHDNDFVIGLIGKVLYPLSSIVQAMR